MTLMEFVGCGLVAYSQIFLVCLYFVFNDPIRIIIFVSSAFLWLVSFLLSAIFWNYIMFRHVLILSLIMSVIFQELIRYAMYCLHKKAANILNKLNVPNTNKEVLYNKFVVPLAAGCGFAAMSGCFSYVNILAEMVGPGTHLPPHFEGSFVLYGAFNTACFCMLHISWSILFYHGLEVKNYWYVGSVVASHLLASCITVIVTDAYYYYGFVLVMLMTMIMFYQANELWLTEADSFAMRENIPGFRLLRSFTRALDNPR